MVVVTYIYKIHQIVYLRSVCLYIIYTLKKRKKIKNIRVAVCVCVRVCVVYRCWEGGVHAKMPSKQRTKCGRTTKWRKANGATA